MRVECPECEDYLNCNLCGREIGTGDMVPASRLAEAVADLAAREQKITALIHERDAAVSGRLRAEALRDDLRRGGMNKIDSETINRTVEVADEHRTSTGAHSNHHVRQSVEVLAASTEATVRRFGMTPDGLHALLEVAYFSSGSSTAGAESPDDWAAGFLEGALFGLMLAEVRDAG